MSNPHDDREGLSPSPSNILDIFAADDEDDDDIDYHPTEEQGTEDGSGLDEDDSDADFIGTNSMISSAHTMTDGFQTLKRP